MKRMLMITALLLLITSFALVTEEPKTESAVFEYCNIESFENDYTAEPKKGDNAYGVKNGTLYYGYCGLDEIREV